jgi:hypothetical protein
VAQLLRELAVSCLTRAPMLLSARAGRGGADEYLLLERRHSPARISCGE